MVAVLPLKATHLVVATRVAATVDNNTKRVLPSRWYVYSFWHSMCYTTYAFQVLPRLRKLQPPSVLPINSHPNCFIKPSHSPSQPIDSYENLRSHLLKILTIYGLDPLLPRMCTICL